MTSFILSSALNVLLSEIGVLKHGLPSVKNVDSKYAELCSSVVVFSFSFHAQ